MAGEPLELGQLALGAGPAGERIADPGEAGKPRRNQQPERGRLALSLGLERVGDQGGVDAPVDVRKRLARALTG